VSGFEPSHHCHLLEIDKNDATERQQDTHHLEFRQGFLKQEDACAQNHQGVQDGLQVAIFSFLFAFFVEVG
jgi:hypothetical protein